MKRLLVLSVTCALLVFSVPASATFHLMQIEQVIGGVGGDATIQAIQLRTRALGQTFVQFSRIRVWDAAGANPIVIIVPAASVLNGASGARILIASAAFAANTTPAAVPDFVMTNLIPVSYLAAGSMTFENSLGTIVYWRLSWGGGSYTGSNVGSISNDVDGIFGPPIAGPLASATAQAVLFPGPSTALSTNNAADYATTAAPAVFRNNAGAAFTVDDPATAASTPPTLARLSQNTPNPFNPSTEISFTMERSGSATLEIFDTRGRFVATLFSGVAPAGLTQRRWTGVDANGVRVGTGVYFYRLTTAHGVEARKMLLLK